MSRWRDAARLARWVPVLCVLAACADDPAGPDEQGVQGDTAQTAQLTFVRFDAADFTGADKTGSFWAVKGENRELRLHFRTATGQEGDRFLEFKVSDDALLARPDGTPFAEGDSILITVTVDAQARFVFDFQPSGLRFDPNEPAELRIEFARSRRDLNGDGVIDERDSLLRQALSIWKQERGTSPWIRLQSLRIDPDRIRADVIGFTGFALAS